MSHVYKNVQKPDEPLSFVKLVTKYGDEWRYMVPAKYHRIGCEESSLRVHEMEAWHMKQMELGNYPRIAWCDQE